MGPARLFAAVLLGATSAAVIVACASFEAEPSPAPAPEASADAPVTDAVSDVTADLDALSTPEGGRLAVAALVSEPTELSAVNNELFIASNSGKLSRWKVTDGPVAPLFANAASPRTRVLASATQIFWRTGAGNLVRERMDASGGNSPASCRSTLTTSFALVGQSNNVVVYGTGSSVEQSPSSDCATVGTVRAAVNAELMTAVPSSSTEVAFYQPSDQHLIRCQNVTVACSGPNLRADVDLGGAAIAIAADASGVYWATEKAIYAMRGDDDSGTLVSPTGGKPAALIAFQGYLYWSVPSTGTVRRVATDGGPKLDGGGGGGDAGAGAATEVATGMNEPRGLAVILDELFIADTAAGKVFRLRL